MSRSQSLYAAAQQVIPGGVNSPVRAFNGVGGTPPFIKKADGAYVYDEDDKAYVDYVGSWGPMILGHGDADVLAAISQQLQQGVSFGAPTSAEITMAELICKLIPSIDMVRMVNSGTEATMSAIRLARGYTSRDKILKFEGCYHGHSDGLLVKAGSGALTMGVPSSPGVPASVTEHTLTAQFNDLESVKQAFAENGEQIAAIIVEPVAGNMNCIPPAAGFLQGLRDICSENGSVLIFDEVMCGFRVDLGGAQSLYGVTPDLTTLGKVIGGGLPVGAFGGRREIMQHLAPAGGVYQAGTLSGNPIAMHAGLATLQKISEQGFFTKLSQTTEALLSSLNDLAQSHGVGFCSNQVGSMFGMFFTEQDSVSDFAEVNRCDIEKFQRFFHHMLDQGVYLAPSAFEAGFMSIRHGQTEIDKTLAAADFAFSRLA